ncbi:threonine ammonia-lyase, biosynthetic [Thioflexithrix psekupsensis]|uniref:L-threonine dehydratase n=1 Tax=Thioflexithrix psekupsensis TaxID=1570016 RepID=A0A251X8F9_9GAMM|nr:threonine ammonia-lyase, biosynthetic [Thioflexithrix psekupsensis]OUD14286.1 threonine ammonia-lyase, biosynthetic [Thioflexithrix psekupsensis]
MLNAYVKKILQARVYDVARKTPLDKAIALSQRLNNHIWLKREDLQPVFSFKIRGAYNRIAHLSAEVRARGVIAASAGNHAQGVALSAARLGIRAVIVMPKTTPDIKVSAVRGFGAEVVLHGSAFDDASQHAQHLMQAEGLTYIPPYDDEDVIAGQGTIGMEILQQHTGELDAIFIPVGGGGLIAGIAAYVKYVRPEVKIIGVEADDSACLYAALQQKERVILDQVGIFADGTAVKQVGVLPFEIAQHYVDDVITVTTDEICAAIKDTFDATRSIAEPSGALALAGLKRYIQQTRCENRHFVTINSGANMNFDRLGYVTERAEIGEQREALFAVTIPERPGSFREFCHTLGQRQITEFNYRYSDSSLAQVFAGIRLTQGASEKEALMAKLIEKSYPVVDLSNNEMAKLHIRHMVGGHGQHVQNERLYRFEFPERPGALLHFLTNIGYHWNISLFHYRNHGSAYGRVLVGIQVPETDLLAFQQFLDTLGYAYWEERDNPAYQLFLN